MIPVEGMADDDLLEELRETITRSRVKGTWDKPRFRQVNSEISKRGVLDVKRLDIRPE